MDCHAYSARTIHRVPNIREKIDFDGQIIATCRKLGIHRSIAQSKIVSVLTSYPNAGIDGIGRQIEVS